jgi:hypothetical protein
VVYRSKSTNQPTNISGFYEPTNHEGRGFVFLAMFPLSPSTSLSAWCSLRGASGTWPVWHCRSALRGATEPRALGPWVSHTIVGRCNAHYSARVIWTTAFFGGCNLCAQCFLIRVDHTRNLMETRRSTGWGKGRRASRRSWSRQTRKLILNRVRCELLTTHPVSCRVPEYSLYSWDAVDLSPVWQPQVGE